MRPGCLLTFYLLCNLSGLCARGGVGSAPCETVKETAHFAVRPRRRAPGTRRGAKPLTGNSLRTYYVLSTNETVPSGEMAEITKLLLVIRQNYGCQVIVNGVATTIKYYLRLVADTDRFVNEYVSLVEKDGEVPFELKRYWNDVVG